MIQKKIHYCWFGRNPKSGLIRQCMESWKKYCPDYEIVEWNEDTFDVSIVRFTAEAYEKKKWAFVSDYVRLYALYHVGGIYLDTDNELLKPMDRFLKNHVFTGFESKDSPITAVIGAEKGNKIIKKLLDAYDDRSFLSRDSGGKSLALQTNTIEISEYFRKLGIKSNGKLQHAHGLTVYPAIVFCPNNLSRVWNKPSSRSYAIHHFDQSWKEETITNRDLKHRLRRYLVGLGRDIFSTEKMIMLSECKKRSKS